MAQSEADKKRKANYIQIQAWLNPETKDHLEKLAYDAAKYYAEEKQMNGKQTVINGLLALINQDYPDFITELRSGNATLNEQKLDNLMHSVNRLEQAIKNIQVGSPLHIAASDLIQASRDIHNPTSIEESIADSIEVYTYEDED